MTMLRYRQWALQLRAATLFLLSLVFASAAYLRGAEPTPDGKGTSASPPETYNSPTNGLGSWIWSNQTSNGQTCLFWRAFEIPAEASVAKARLGVTADNEFTLYLDGRELGHGAEWHELFMFDPGPLLTPGRHVLALEGINSFSYAGVLFGLRIDLADGRVVEVKSDQSWRVVPNGVNHWEKLTRADPDWRAATIIAPLGGLPWWTQPVAVNMMPTLRPNQVLFWQTGWFQISLGSLCGLVILISLRLVARLARNEKDRLLLRQERARIAREIHDDIGSRMTQLVLHGEVAQSELPEDSETHKQLVQICEDARGLLSTMDEILWAVNPQRDTLRDFTAYVCNYAQEFLKPTQIQCLFEMDPEMSAAALDLPLRRNLLMAIKETLNNAVKHSQATELRLKIQWQGPRLIVVIQDNGRGFDTSKAKADRNGLFNMAHRMSELGGSCDISSQPGKGCRVEFSIPLKQPRRHAWGWVRNANPLSERMKEMKNATKREPAESHDPTGR
jgi:signal transduction histidine kinase